MKTFRKKKIVPNKRVCLNLKQARLQKGVTLADLERTTKISQKYLQALEECRFSELTCADIYQKNFIRTYVKALDLDPAPFLEQFSHEELAFTKKKVKHPHRGYKKYYFTNLPQTFRYAITLCLLLAVSLYLGGQIKNTLEPPELTITNPQDGHITTHKQIQISGHTEPEVSISINGEQIMSDTNGGFSEAVSLNPGINTIRVEATKKHGKTSHEMRHIIMKEVAQLGLRSER